MFIHRRAIKTSLILRPTCFYLIARALHDLTFSKGTIGFTAGSFHDNNTGQDYSFINLVKDYAVEIVSF